MRFWVPRVPLVLSSLNTAEGEAIESMPSVQSKRLKKHTLANSSTTYIEITVQLVDWKSHSTEMLLTIQGRAF